MRPNLPEFPGWHLIGSYPEDDPDGVGSWLVNHEGYGMLLEIPPGMNMLDVCVASSKLQTAIRHVTASHKHFDHLNKKLWKELAKYPIDMIDPDGLRGDTKIMLGGEPLWLVKAPKHSTCDVVTVFRGVAMTGDIELQTLESVNDEVPRRTKRKSMAWLRDFPKRNNYQIHSIVSAHLNDVRVNVDWPSLFEV